MVETLKEIRKEIEEVIKKYSSILSIHGLYIDESYKIVSFDVVFNFNADNNCFSASSSIPNL